MAITTHGWMRLSSHCRMGYARTMYGYNIELDLPVVRKNGTKHKPIRTTQPTSYEYTYYISEPVKEVKVPKEQLMPEIEEVDGAYRINRGRQRKLD